MAESLAGIDYLGRCYDIFDLDPLDMAGSVKLPPAIRLPDEKNSHLGYEVPVGVNFSAPRKSTVLTTEGLIYNSSDFTREVSKSLDLSAGFDGIGSFGASSSVRSVESETQSRKFVFKYVIAVVKNFIVELRDDLSGLTPAAEFAQAVAGLPTNPSPAYRAFISKFGTHFTVRISLGGMAFQSVRANASTYRKSNETQEAFEANASLEISAFKAQSKYEEKKAEIHKRDNESELSRSSITIVGATGGTSLPEEWFSKLEAQPIPLPEGARLKKLSDLFNPAFFPEDHAIAAKRQLLEEEIKKYSNERGGQLGEELRYGDAVRLQVRFPTSRLLLRVTPKGFYIVSESIIKQDPEATIILHDPANPGKTGHLVYTSRNPNESSALGLWIKELNCYLAMKEPVRADAPNYRMFAEETVSNDLKQPRSQWMARCISGSLARSSSLPRQPVVSGDELVICRWDQPSGLFFRLGEHGLQGNRMFIIGSQVDPLYSDPEDDFFQTQKFVLTKLGSKAEAQPA